jgi:hypothetical protein
MSKLNYSNLKNNKSSIHKYAFFNDEKDKNIDLENNNLVEGIANFCALNRSKNNQWKDGWNNLESSMNNISKKINDIDKTNLNNNNIIDSVGGGIDNAGAVVDSDQSSPMKFGKMRIYSTDYKKLFDIRPVDIDGIFRAFPDDYAATPTKYKFVYENTNGRLRKTNIIDNTKEGFVEGNQSGKTPDVSVAVTDNDFDESNYSSGSGSGDSRGLDGKLKNTEEKNSGAESRYYNMQKIYNETFINTINLGVGVLAAIIFITKKQ